MTGPLLAEGVVRRVGGGGSAFTLVIEWMAVAPGARIAVVGPSGCGKSTMLALLALALRPDEGKRLEVGGADALGLWRRGDGDGLAALRASRVGLVPQTGGLLPFLTLRENIALPQRVLAAQRRGRVDGARVEALAERLGIAGVLGRMPGKVSVGQRQRAAVARALAHRPGVVLADEPTASVHPAQADEVLALLTEVAEEDGAALVISTHDAGRAEAAGYAIAPCRPDGDGVTTRFSWP